MSDFNSWGSAPLGSLRSELDEGSDLQNEFIMLESYAQAVRHAFITGRIEPNAAAGILSALRLTGGDGAVWSIGATTGSWYRKIDSGWVQSQPPYGVKVIEGESPDWLRFGVANELNKAELILKEKVQGKKATEKKFKSAPEINVPADELLNISESNPVKEDLDWVLQEWGMLPEVPGSAGLRGSSRAQGIQTSDDWDPDNAVDSELGLLTDDVSKVSPRAESNENLPFDASMPQDFFLPPDEDK